MDLLEGRYFWEMEFGRLTLHSPSLTVNILGHAGVVITYLLLVGWQESSQSGEEGSVQKPHRVEPVEWNDLLSWVVQQQLCTFRWM